MNPASSEFQRRKRELQHRSGQMSFLNRLGAAGVPTDTFPHWFLSESQSETYYTALQPWLGLRNPDVKVVSGWDAIRERVREWATHQVEVGVLYADDNAAGVLVVPGGVFARWTDAFRTTARQDDLMVVTPDGSAGVVYFEEEHDNVWGCWEPFSPSS